jgi:hypothetical protein
MFSTEAGMEIDEQSDRDLYSLANAPYPIDESLESGSNVIDERDGHSAKQDLESSTTDEGIHTDESNKLFEKTASSIHTSLAPNSNVTTDTE